MNTQKKTIAIFAPYFPPHIGGLERYAYEIAMHLHRDRGWRVVVITSGNQYGHDSKEEIDGVTIYRLGFRWKFSNTPFSFSWIRKVRAILKEEQPEIINIHMPVAGMGDVAALLAGKTPIVVTYHAGSMIKKSILPDLVIWLYEHIALNIILHRANRIICSSDFVRFTFLGRYMAKSITITPAVDSDAFHPDPAKKTKKPTILFVAALGWAERYKGIKTLIDAVGIVKKKFPDVRLSVVGDGDMRSVYEAYVKEKELEDTVIFKGRLMGEKLVAAYQEATLFALPSSNDSSPTVIIEAMSAGLPVISTNIGGIPVLVDDHKTGYLIDPDDHEVLAQKISALLMHPDIAEALGKAGQEKAARQYDWHNRVIEYDRFLRDTMKPEPRTGLRVAVVAPYFYPKVGGVEVYVLETVKALRRNGHDPFIITSQPEGEPLFDQIEGIRVYRLPVLFKVSNTPIHPLWGEMIEHIFENEKPDLINAHTPVPFMADVAERARGKVPFILTYHNDLIKTNPALNILAQLEYIFFTNKTLRRADKIITTSNYYADQSYHLSGVQNKISIVPPGVDTDRYKFGITTPYFKERFNNAPTVLFVGQLDFTHAHKGLSDTLLAIKRVKEKIPNIMLVIVGRGDYADHYKSEAKRLGLEKNVSFEGFVENAFLPQYYAGSDVLVLASRDKAEGFGMVIMEAAACGTPAVASRVGGIPAAIVDGSTGILIPPHNVAELTAALEKVLLDPALRDQLGKQAAQRIAEEFSWKTVLKKFFATVDEVMERNPSVTQVSSYYPPHLGGLERVVEEMAQQLARDHYPVTVLTSRLGGKGLPKTEMHPNLAVKRLGAFEFAHTAVIPGLFWQLLRIRKPAVFHLHLAQAYTPEMVWLAAKLRGIPYVVHFHLDVEPSGTFGFAFVWWKKIIQPIIIKGAAFVITLSPEQSRLIHDRYGKPAEQIRFIGNGVGEQFLAIGKKARKLHDPLRFIFVGRLALQKRPDRLVEALSLIRSNVALDIVGDGEDRQKLEALAVKLNLNEKVRFLGRLDGANLLAAYQNADVFVLPSDKEGMPLVLLEAMATGLPVIGSDVLGIKELIKGVGILVPDPSPRTFANAIDALAADPGQLPALGAASMRKAEDYSWKTLVGRVEGIYKEIIK